MGALQLCDGVVKKHSHSAWGIGNILLNRGVVDVLTVRASNRLLTTWANDRVDDEGFEVRAGLGHLQKPLFAFPIGDVNVASC